MARSGRRRCHATFSIYAQGVGETTALLPDGWRDRLVRHVEPSSGVVAWCLELHDLWVSKAIAGRPEDREFCDALLRDGLVAANVLGSRADLVARATEDQRNRAHRWIERAVG